LRSTDVQCAVQKPRHVRCLEESIKLRAIPAPGNDGPRLEGRTVAVEDALVYLQRAVMQFLHGLKAPNESVSLSMLGSGRMQCVQLLAHSSRRGAAGRTNLLRDGARWAPVSSELRKRPFAACFPPAEHSHQSTARSQL